MCKRELFRYRKLTDKPADTDKLQKSDSKTNIAELAAGIFKIFFILQKFVLFWLFCFKVGLTEETP